MAISSRCTEMNFILKGEGFEETIEGVDVFNYLGRLLYWSDGIFGRRGISGDGWGNL